MFLYMFFFIYLYVLKMLFIHIILTTVRKYGTQTKNDNYLHKSPTACRVNLYHTSDLIVFFFKGGWDLVVIVFGNIAKLTIKYPLAKGRAQFQLCTLTNYYLKKYSKMYLMYIVPGISTTATKWPECRCKNQLHRLTESKKQFYCKISLSRLR